MRLWSLHPTMLDGKGLVALWREALGAQKAICQLVIGEPGGYQKHPQLERFMAHEDPRSAITNYLSDIHFAATLRDYKFDSRRIQWDFHYPSPVQILVTQGQVDFELTHLRRKVHHRARAEDWRIREVLLKPELTMVHPLFKIVPGEVESWEKG